MPALPGAVEADIMFGFDDDRTVEAFQAAVTAKECGKRLKKVPMLCKMLFHTAKCTPGAMRASYIVSGAADAGIAPFSGKKILERAGMYKRMTPTEVTATHTAIQELVRLMTLNGEITEADFDRLLIPADRRPTKIPRDLLANWRHRAEFVSCDAIRKKRAAEREKKEREDKEAAESKRKKDAAAMARDLKKGKELFDGDFCLEDPDAIDRDYCKIYSDTDIKGLLRSIGYVCAWPKKPNNSPLKDTLLDVLIPLLPAAKEERLAEHIAREAEARKAAAAEKKRKAAAKKKGGTGNAKRSKR